MSQEVARTLKDSPSHTASRATIASKVLHPLLYTLFTIGPPFVSKTPSTTGALATAAAVAVETIAALALALPV